MATVKLKFHLMVNVYTFQIVYHTHLGSILGAHSIRTHTHTRSAEIREIRITLCAAQQQQQQQQQIHWQLPRFIEGLLYANSIFNTSITSAQQYWCRELWHMKFSVAFFFLPSILLTACITRNVHARTINSVVMWIAIADEIWFLWNNTIKAPIK